MSVDLGRSALCSTYVIYLQPIAFWHLIACNLFKHREKSFCLAVERLSGHFLRIQSSCAFACKPSERILHDVEFQGKHSFFYRVREAQRSRGVSCRSVFNRLIDFFNHLPSGLLHVRLSRESTYCSYFFSTDAWSFLVFAITLAPGLRFSHLFEGTIK